MEKLFIKVVFFLLLFQITAAQESLCVYKVNGTVTLNKKTKSLSKGMLIQKKDNIKLSSKSKLILIDDKGSVFALNKPGSYTFKTILTSKKNTESSALTAKYFSFIWSELTNEKKEKKAIAGVFRGNVLMKYPPNNASIEGLKIIFKWENDLETSQYLFICNLEDKLLLKIETKSNEMGFYLDNEIFENEKNLKWVVTNEEFPNLKNIPFYSFKTLTYDEYEQIIKEHQSLIDELNSLGLTQQEINEAFCEFYGICSEE
ncbi:hypothetical protein [Yeosuana sp.]|uniref:hypothetical protein n=1 Tax=Yeosuana sp. TaxID=2529388 RepID=UPI00404B0BA8